MDQRQGADPGAAEGRVLSLLGLRIERLDVSLLFLLWRPYAAGIALKAEYFCFLHPDPYFLSASRLVNGLVS